MVLVFIATPVPAHAEDVRTPTYQQCEADTKALGQHLDKLMAMSFKQLFTVEKEEFACAKEYKNYAFSEADATITQLQLTRVENFITEHKLDSQFLEEDAAGNLNKIVQ
jgi:hypothetical protein